MQGELLSNGLSLCRKSPTAPYGMTKVSILGVLAISL